MFDAINIPYGAKMLFNVVKLKSGVSFDDIELTIGEMCNAVKIPTETRKVGLSRDRSLSVPDLFRQGGV